MNGQGPEQAQSVALPIQWVVPPSLVSRYATNLVVQASEHEFVLSFFEAYPPLVFGPPPEGTVARAECVARIVITPQRLAEFVQVLQDAVARHPRSQPETKER
jgi:hypothetical protein